MFLRKAQMSVMGAPHGGDCSRVRLQYCSCIIRMLVVLSEHHYMYHYTYYGLSENVGVHLAHPHDRAVFLS